MRELAADGDLPEAVKIAARAHQKLVADWPPWPIRGIRILAPNWWAVLDLNQ
jgi:hypothetical protein